MENILYFAVFGTKRQNYPQNCKAVYGGFGFHRDGSVRIPYAPPQNAAILFDDRTIPERASLSQFTEFCTRYQIKTVIFDFEQPKNEQLIKLLRTAASLEWIAPVQYASCCPSAVLCASYFPKEPFAAYLRRIRTKIRNPVLDMFPVCCSVCGGTWTKESQAPERGGRLSAANRCMYLTQQTGNGLKIRFYDTQKTVLLRAKESGLPCLLPLAEFERLPKE